MKTISLALALFLSLSVLAQADTSQVYTVVQQMPQFPGGQDSMNRFLMTHIKYPAGAADSAVQGRVVVGYVVNRDGSVSDVTVKRGIHPLLDAEAVRVVQTFPPHKAGMQSGMAVRVGQVVPVTFRITKVPEFTLPVFPGGEQAMKDYVKANLRHKDGADGFLGTVPVGFDIDSAGNVSNAHCMVSVPADIDSEAVRVISSFPRMNPARQIGKPVSSQIIFKVNFFDEKLVVNADGYYNGMALDRQPSFAGGKKAEKDFFEKQLYRFYQMKPKDQRLRVEVAVNPDSTTTGIRVVKSIDAKTDAELLRVMSQARFDPGVYNGKAVKTHLIYDIDSVTDVSDTAVAEMALPVFEGMPRFPGGELAMMRFIQMNIQYPAQDREVGIQGRVIASFVVNKEGQLEDIQIKKGVSKNIDAEALRIIHLLPDFIPGTQQGKPVKVKYFLPLMFKLS